MITTVRIVVALVMAALSAPVSAAPSGSLATYALGPGWATFGLALPQGAAQSAVKVGTLPTQTDVKVRWPDGSIRFAIVTAKIVKAGSYPIFAAAQPPGTVSASLPPAGVTFTIQGRSYVAALPNAAPDRWLSGPLVTDARAVVAPGGHPFLRVIFDVRSYAGGGHRVDVTVENCLDTASADQVTYDVAIAVGGAPVFQRKAVTHKYLARWRQTFLTDGLRESAVTTDFAPFFAAHAIPAYLASVPNPARSVASFDILGFGDLTRPMDAHGGRPELAPYPDWAAQFIVHGKAEQRAYVLRNGELAGSWGIHIREGDGQVPTIDRFPYYWLDPRWKDNGGFQGPANVRKENGSFVIPGRAEPGDIAHQPSLAFVPYLVTGDRYFADEMAFWANFCLIG